MQLDEAYTELAAGVRGRVRRDEPLARHTTFRVGGPAALFIECDIVSDLQLSLDVLARNGLPWTVLGRGSNIIAADAGYEGAVIVLGREFRRHNVEGGRLRCGAGVALGAVVQDAFARGLTGLEFCVGIPGTIGGALAMNAGSRDEWIGSKVETVTLFVEGRGLESLRGPEVGWGYRRSGLGARGVIVEASLALDEGDGWTIRQTMEAALSRRKRTQPLSVPNAGSIFVNPEGDSAGRLIEQCSLKGHVQGGAKVSEMHANFIVNNGGATAADIVSLIRLIQKSVKEVHGVDLQTEVRFLGSFAA